jgi:hypothetical protein
MLGAYERKASCQSSRGTATDEVTLPLLLELIRSHLKNASDTRWRRRPPLKNAHTLARVLRVFIGGRLALGH